MKKPIFLFSKPKPRIALLGLLMFASFSTTQAQETFVASGSNIAGAGGTASYSVGQILQNTVDGDGSVVQGIQISFESSTLQIIDMQTNLDITTYPNPTTSILNMNVTDYSPNTLTYDLFDLSGRRITSGKVTQKKTSIHVEHLDMATYLLKVHNKNKQTTKILKIIKK